MSAIYSNVGDVPLALAVFLASDNYDYNSDPDTISATTLLKPIRQILLPSRIPAGEGLVDLSAMTKNRIGNAIHDGIENAWKNDFARAMGALGYPGKITNRIRINPTATELIEYAKAGIEIIPIYLEQRFERKLGKWTITGKADFIGDGRVQDFKSTSVWTYKNQVNSEKYPQQGSIYRWLKPTIITQDEMDIHYIFLDWKQGMVRSDPNYPPKQLHRQSFPLLSLRQTEAFIQSKLNLIEQYQDAPEPELPLCDDEELWRSEPVFKYYKNPAKTARSTKNFDTLLEARTRFVEDGSVGAIKEVPGQVMACKYCPAFAICTQKDALVASGDLLLG